MKKRNRARTMEGRLLALLFAALLAFSMCACKKDDEPVTGSKKEKVTKTPKPEDGDSGTETDDTPPVVDLELPEASEEDFEYTDDGGGGIRIIMYKGSKKDVGVPEKIEGKQVTVIGNEAFRYREQVENVTIPEGVTELGECAFFCCKNLKNVKLPDSLKRIGQSAFIGCSNLVGVSIPGGVTEIGESAFAQTGIKSVVVPAGIAALADYTFSDCVNLKSVTLPDSITFLGKRALAGCEALERIVLPAGITEIDEEAFYSCTGLKEVVFPSGLEKIGGSAFKACESLASLNLPDGLASMGEDAFRSCSALTEISLPGSLSVIPSYAFGFCENLEKVTFGSGVTTIDTGAFECCKNLKEIVFADTLRSVERYAFSNCEALVSVTLPNGLSFLEEKAFYECPKLVSVTYKGTTYDKEHLTDAWGAVNSGADAPFDYAEKDDGTISLLKYTGASTEVVIPDEVNGKPVTELGEGVFMASQVVRVSIPDSVTHIGDKAFASCGELVEVKMGSNVKAIGNAAFEYCSSLPRITLPDGLTSIGDNAFASCYALDGVVIPYGVTAIGEYAFEKCDELKSITVPGSVKEVGEGMFFACWGLERAVLEEGVPSVSEYMFDQCAILREISIPGSVGYIANYGFGSCHELTQVAFPADLGTIALRAFSNCEKLDNIRIPDGCRVETEAFGFCTGLKTVILPDSAYAARDAFKGCPNIRINFRGTVYEEATLKNLYDVCANPNSSPEPTKAPAAPTRNPYLHYGDYAGAKTSLADANVGDVVLFGTYEQDGDKTNGTEPIAWYVLDKKGNELFLFSVYLLDSMAYCTYEDGGNSYWGKEWKDCTIRKWLNGEFYRTAFSAAEQGRIQTTKLTSVKNPYEDEYAEPFPGGTVTEDKVFLLSIEEVEKYFPYEEKWLTWRHNNDNQRRMAGKITAYFYKEKYTDGWRVDAYEEGYPEYWEAYCISARWWLRSEGYKKSYATIVDGWGDIFIPGDGQHYIYGIRPALWVTAN